MPRLTALNAPPLMATMGPLDPLRRVRHPLTGAYAIPVFSFGDPWKATVATISLNPSHQEFLDRNGRPLNPDKQRFAAPWINGTQTVSSIQTDCNAYFSRTTTARRTYYGRWFGPMENLLQHRLTTTKGLSYLTGTACHLDLSPWPSDPAWGNLWQLERDEHVRIGKAVLLEQLGFPNGNPAQARSPSAAITKIILNGATTMASVLNALAPGTSPTLSPIPGTDLKVASGSILGINYIGWNLYLQRSGSWIADHVAPYI